MKLTLILFSLFTAFNIVFLVLPLFRKGSKAKSRTAEITGPKPERQYEMDWLRVIAIVILLYFHTGMMFVRWDWHIQNTETSVIFEQIMMWLHHWRMPLLLFISGAGTYFALGFRSSGKFLAERSKRLFIPLIFGIFVIVPPQIYYERIANFTSYRDFYPTVFQFVPYPLGGSLSWHHLWFVLYLGIYSMIALPFFLYLRSPKSKRFFNKLLQILERRSGFLLPLVLLIGSQVILRPFFPHETHGLDDWAYFVFYFLFFVFGFVAYCEPRIRDIMLKQRRFNLIAAILSTVFMYLVFWVRFEYTPLVRWGQLYHLAAMAVTWLWVVAFIGYGRKFLAFKKPVLKYANEAIYPFYILHQTVIIFFGYYLIPWQVGIFTKFAVVSTVSLVSSLAIYYLFIRPFAVMRVLFGVKLVKEKAIVKVTQPAPPAHTLEPVPVKTR
ncbi:MAG: acyltransferase [bacterium]|nr:acyltransferase [bacterium]